MSRAVRTVGRHGRSALWVMACVLGLWCAALPARAEPVLRAAAPSEGAAAPSIYALDTLVPPVAAGVAPEGAEDLLEAGPEEIDRGTVSWYGGRFHGRRTASGERFDMYALTAAHPTLPFGTRIKVRRLDTGKEVEVRINDRGPHTRGRILDLSRAAALALGVVEAGEATVALLPP